MSSDPLRAADGVLPPSAASALILASYARIVGRRLVPEGFDEAEAARWLYHDAPFCLVAHDTAPDPIFFYANKTAQSCFEYVWDAFVALPSRLSAEAPNRAERQALLDRVAREGFASGYSGMRISRSGRRFMIEDGIVWQLMDERGVSRGQGAMVPRWRDASSSAGPPP